jgi:hypothetical protein
VRTGNATHAEVPPDTAGSGVFGWPLAMLGHDVGFPVAQGGTQNVCLAAPLRESLGGQVLTLGPGHLGAPRERPAVGVRLLKPAPNCQYGPAAPTGENTSLGPSIDSGNHRSWSRQQVVLQHWLFLGPGIWSYLNQILTTDFRDDDLLWVDHELDDAGPVQDGRGHHPPSCPFSDQNVTTRRKVASQLNDRVLVQHGRHAPVDDRPAVCAPARSLLSGTQLRSPSTRPGRPLRATRGRAHGEAGVVEVKRSVRVTAVRPGDPLLATDYRSALMWRSRCPRPYG